MTQFDQPINMDNTPGTTPVTPVEASNLEISPVIEPTTEPSKEGFIVLSDGTEHQFKSWKLLKRKQAMVLRSKSFDNIKLSSDNTPENPSQIIFNSELVQNELVKFYFDLEDTQLDELADADFQLLFTPIDQLDPLGLKKAAKTLNS